MSSHDPNTYNLERDLTELLDGMLKIALVISPDSPEGTLRRRIVSANLRAMVQVILIADDPGTNVQVNLKQLCLSLLVTADWLNPGEVDDAFPGDAELS